MSFEQGYVDIIQHVLMNGTSKEGRNGNTISIFGVQLVANELMDDQFPLLNGRKMYYKPVFGELAAFFNYPEHLRDFETQGCHYWEKWANEDGTVNVDYGNAWMADGQLNDVKEGIITNPNSRRHLVTGWRHDNLKNLSLPCCHYAYQWRVRGTYLDMIWIQRSVDLMIGLPSDIILAAAWNIIMASLTGYKPGVLTFQLGDVHIYEEHRLDALNYMRQFNSTKQQCPNYIYPYEIKEFSEFKSDDITILNYNPSDPINFLLKV